jgi:hypothetical protein
MSLIRRQRGKAKAHCFTGSCGAPPVGQPPPEKCDVNARANEPKPPRVTPPEPESDKVPDGERLDEESLLKKLLRDDDPPDQPRPPLDEDPRGGHSALVWSPDGAAIPGRVSQFSLGISP